MTEIDMTACPFCGGVDLRHGGDDKFVGTYCLTCQATGPNHYITGRDWSTRAAPDRTAEIARLLRCLSDLLQLHDGVPLHGMESERRIDAARAALTAKS